MRHLFTGFTKEELEEVWYLLTRDECGWPPDWTGPESVSPADMVAYRLAIEVRAEATARGLPGERDEYDDFWTRPPLTTA